MIYKMTNLPLDVSRCNNDECELRFSCRRFMELNPLIPFNQYLWVTTFEPKTIDKVLTCDGFIKLSLENE